MLFFILLCRNWTLFSDFTLFQKMEKCQKLHNLVYLFGLSPLRHYSRGVIGTPSNQTLKLYGSQHQDVPRQRPQGPQGCPMGPNFCSQKISHMMLFYAFLQFIMQKMPKFIETLFITDLLLGKKAPNHFIKSNFCIIK